MFWLYQLYWLILTSICCPSYWILLRQFLCWYGIKCFWLLRWKRLYPIKARYFCWFLSFFPVSFHRERKTKWKNESFRSQQLFLNFPCWANTTYLTARERYQINSHLDFLPRATFCFTNMHAKFLSVIMHFNPNFNISWFWVHGVCVLSLVSQNVCLQQLKHLGNGKFWLHYTLITKLWLQWDKVNSSLLHGACMICGGSWLSD